ncbi:MAG: hypothetical protein ACI3XR_02855 [Eubacteriales bacterium]
MNNNQGFNEDQQPIRNSNTQPAPGKGMAIAGMVLGIISCVIAWFAWINILGLITGIIGLILAVKGRKQLKSAGAPTGIGTAGLVLAVIGTVLAGIGFLSCTVCLACVGAGLSELASTSL